MTFRPFFYSLKYEIRNLSGLDKFENLPPFFNSCHEAIDSISGKSVGMRVSMESPVILLLKSKRKET